MQIGSRRYEIGRIQGNFLIITFKLIINIIYIKFETFKYRYIEALHIHRYLLRLEFIEFTSRKSEVDACSSAEIQLEDTSYNTLDLIKEIVYDNIVVFSLDVTAVHC